MRLAISLLVLALAVNLARADEPPPDAATLEEARRRFAEGQRLFEAGELKPAVEELKEAYRLTKNPLLLYNIGLIYDKLDDKSLALHYYTRFVDDAKDTEKSHAQLAEASKRSSELRAELAIEEPPASQPTPGEEAPAPTLTELQHEVIDQAPPGRPIDVTARVPRRAPWSVTLHYRAAGQDLYQPVKMRPRSGASLTPDIEELVARIPAAAVQGSAVQYHVAARDPDGKLVGFSGKSQTPNIIYLDPAAPPHNFDDAAARAGAPVAPLPPAAAPGPPDRPTRPLTYAKWAASGTAVALVGTGIALNLVARDYGGTLEDEAMKSTTETCSDGLMPPCRGYSQQRKDIDASGKSYEKWSNITLIAGAATALAAGALWYFDAKAAVVPVVGKDSAGLAAAWRF